MNFGGGVYTHDLFWQSLSPTNTEPFFEGAFKEKWKLLLVAYILLRKR